jgi:hypothetical protein
MRWLRCRVAPARRGWLLAVLGPLGLSLVMTGCAASSAEPVPAAQSSVQGDRMSEAEAEFVIARAVTAHERRRP